MQPAISALLLFTIIAGTLPAAEQEPDWWKAQGEVTAWLLNSNTPIARLVSDVTARPATDGPAAMFKLSVLMRAGMNQAAIGALRELKALCPNLGSSQVSSIYFQACDNDAAWDVAKAVVEVFADNFTELSLENRLLKHFLDSGWTVEQVDEWFAARPKGIHSCWVKERLRFNQSHGRGDALAKQLAEEVRRNPREVTNAIVFLDALLYARQGAQPPDLSWLAGVVRPVRATDARELAERLQQLENWSVALTYYQQAIATPLTDSEIHALGSMRQMILPGDTLRWEFAASAREAMAECLLKLGRKDEAQKWMVEAADIREQHRLGRNALLAGRVQAESGQRVIERRITEAEKKSEDDPDYWRERAEYFRGRKESAREEEALKKGLALTRPLPRQPGKAPADRRGWLMSDYARFLAREGRAGEAVALLRKELAEAPAEAASALQAAHLLAFDFSRQVRADDAVLWNWLANRPAWEYAEERLLWRMLENAPKETLDQQFARAEALAAGKNASRAYTLGWIMNRMHFAKRSLPLLEYAAETAPDAEGKERAAFALFESYLDTGDWKKAEAIFPKASRRLTSNEIPDWLVRVARTAAGSGAKADALRLWSRAANVNPAAALGTLPEMARLGLRSELADFYRAMQQELPASEIPAKALKLLEEAR